MATKKVNQFYVLYATEHLIIDEDEQGLYCDVISESDISKSHRVHVDETTVIPVATHCTCGCYEHKGDCKHCTIVNSFYARIYKSNFEKLAAKLEEQEVEEPTYWDKDQCCRCYVSTRKPVNPAEQEAKLAAQQLRIEQESKVTDISTKGNFGGKPFSLLKVG